MVQKMLEHMEEVVTSSTLPGESSSSCRRRAAPGTAAGSSPSTPGDLPAQGHPASSPAPELNGRII